MTRFTPNVYLIVLLIAGFSCGSKQNLPLDSPDNEKSLIIDYANNEIEYSGRIDTVSTNAAQLSWSGSSVKINFEGSSIDALLKDETGDNYYNVIVDEDSMFILQPETSKQYYTLAKSLKKGAHSVEIFKRTEWTRGKTLFYGFRIEGDTQSLLEPNRKTRKMEFYGNSITAGYAVEDFSGGDSPEGTYTNNYLSYSSIVARNYNATQHVICRSGIGIMLSWFPQIMPDIYDRLIPSDPASKWDFDQYKPDIVVVNLFQNDSWLVKNFDHQEFKKKFKDEAPDEQFIVDSYQRFVSSLRRKYPDANIICMLGNMDATREGSAWPEYVKQAVRNLEDEKIYTHFVKYKESSGHPSIKEQQDMANSLIAFIDENIVW
ncbi:MAG: hypothetical protein JXR03_08910 [Cyclobacteriaceae bacterium]